MAHDAAHALTRSPGIGRLSTTRSDRRGSLHGYSGKWTRPVRPEGPETRGTAACCIRSKSSRFVVHSFREGNTRAQFVFYSQLSRQAGYVLATDQFAPGAALRDEFVQARFHGQDTGRNDRLAAVLDKAVRPVPQVPSDAPRASVGQIRATLQRVAAAEEAGRHERHRAPEPEARGREELRREL